jgi:hypothetical protein
MGDIGSPMLVEDTEDALWTTGDYNCATLAFYVPGNLLGAFTLNSNAQTGSKFEFRAPVSTCGTWTRNGGGVALPSGYSGSFMYKTFAVGSWACGNPTANTASDQCGGTSYYLTTDTNSEPCDPPQEGCP